MSSLNEYIFQGATEYSNPNLTKPNGYTSSSAYGAKLITWYLLHHTGQMPRSISNSRGYTYNVTDGNGIKFKARIVDYQNYRVGVEAIG